MRGAVPKFSSSRMAVAVATWWLVWAMTGDALSKLDRLDRTAYGQNGWLGAAGMLGCAQSDYVLNFTIGGQMVSLIVDTGSTTLGVASNMCGASEGCTGVTRSYSPSASPTAVDQGAAVGARYGDGASWAGRAFSDTVSVADQTVENFVLSTIDVAAGGFFSHAACGAGPGGLADDFIEYDGIAGLAMAPLASPPTDALLDRLALSPKQFSMQVCDGGGAITLGPYDTSGAIFDPTQLAWTPGIGWPNSGFYTVDVVSLDFGGLSFSLGSTIVDSGTTALVVPPAVLAAIAARLEPDDVWTSAFGTGFWTSGQCRLMRGNWTVDALNARLPRLTLRLPCTDTEGISGCLNVTLLPIRSLVLPFADDETPGAPPFWCPAIAASTSLGSGRNIIGTAVLNQLTTVYDLDAQRIGFAPNRVVPCDVLLSNSTTFVATETAAVACSADVACPANTGTFNRPSLALCVLPLFLLTFIRTFSY